jgi:hypothetical protein
MVDFVQGITVDSQNGRLFLQLKNHLRITIFLNYPTRDQEKTTTMRVLIIQNQKKYVYRNMYRNNNQVRCRTSIKNKFLLRGSINRQAVTKPIAFNVPRVLLLLLRAEEFRRN